MCTKNARRAHIGAHQKAGKQGNEKGSGAALRTALDSLPARNRGKAIVRSAWPEMDAGRIYRLQGTHSGWESFLTAR